MEISAYCISAEILNHQHTQITTPTKRIISASEVVFFLYKTKFQITQFLPISFQSRVLNISSVRSYNSGSSVRHVDLTQVPISVLQQAIAQKAEKVKQLTRRHAHLTKKLKVIDRKIQEAGGSTRYGSRAHNSKTLLETIQELPDMKDGKQVKDIVVAVQAAGYQSNSLNFRTIVNQTLLNYPKIFKNVGRGKYTLANSRKHRKPQASNPSTRSTTNELATTTV